MAKNKTKRTLAQVQDGQLVRFRQKMRSPLLKNWGTFEITAIFPDNLGAQISDHIRHLNINDKVSFTIDINQQVHYESLIIETDKKNLSGIKDLKPGMIFSADLHNGKQSAYVKEIKADKVLLDLNHPMAGEKDIEITIEIMEIRAPTEQEILTFAERGAPIATII